MMKLSDTQIGIATDLGWNYPEILSDDVVSLIKRIEDAFKDKKMKTPTTVQLYVPRNDAKKRTPFYAFGNQNVFEVTRTCTAGIPKYTSNHEQLMASFALRHRLKEMVGAMLGCEDGFEVYAYVDNMVDDYIVDPSNILQTANFQADILIERSQLGNNIQEMRQVFDEFVQDYEKVLMRTHMYHNTSYSHFYMVNKNVIKDLERDPVSSKFIMGNGKVREYRLITITPNAVPLFTKESYKQNRKSTVGVILGEPNVDPMAAVKAYKQENKSTAGIILG